MAERPRPPAMSELLRQKPLIGMVHLPPLPGSPRSPDPPSFERVKAVRDVVDAPVLIGSGVSLANVADFYAASDGVLIGETDFKIDHVWGGRSDGKAYAEAVKRCRG